MKINKFELKDKSIEELVKIEKVLIKDLFDYRFNKVFSSSNEPNRASNLKRMIARVKMFKSMLKSKE